jgi:hypothetical protein
MEQRSGADLADPIMDQLHRRGHTTYDLDTRGDEINYQDFNAVLDFFVITEKSSTNVRIVIDTQCGSPAEASAS